MKPSAHGDLSEASIELLERLGQNSMMSDFPNLPIFYSTAFRTASFACSFAKTISTKETVKYRDFYGRNRKSPINRHLSAHLFKRGYVIFYSKPGIRFGSVYAIPFSLADFEICLCALKKTIFEHVHLIS